MLRMWLCVLPLALAATGPANAGPTGRGQINVQPGYQQAARMPRAPSCGIQAAFIGCISTGHRASAPEVVQNAYYDLIRPQGHPRSDAVHQADIDLCYDRTGADRTETDTPAFKKCMLGRGYRWMFARNVPQQSAPANPVSSGIDPITQAGIDADTAATQAQSDADIANANAAAAAATQNLGQ
jgi:hypothetical protein